MVHDPLFAAEVGLTLFSLPLFSAEALLFFSPRLADVTRISIKSHKQAIGALMRPVRMMSLDAFAAIFPSSRVLNIVASLAPGPFGDSSGRRVHFGVDSSFTPTASGPRGGGPCLFPELLDVPALH